MIRKIFKPTEKTLILHLPDEYIGKTVEVIAFTSDDVGSNQEIKDWNKITSSAVADWYDENEPDISNIKLEEPNPKYNSNA